MSLSLDLGLHLSRPCHSLDLSSLRRLLRSGCRECSCRIGPCQCALEEGNVVEVGDYPCVQVEIQTAGPRILRPQLCCAKCKFRLRLIFVQCQ